LQFHCEKLQHLQGLFLATIVEHHHQRRNVRTINGSMHIAECFTEGMEPKIPSEVYLLAPSFNQGMDSLWCQAYQNGAATGVDHSPA